MDIDRTIDVKRADTVVLGMGHATLTAVGGAVPLEIKDAAGIIVAGVTIDAGTTLSPVLRRGGKSQGGGRQSVNRHVRSGGYCKADPGRSSRLRTNTQS